MGFLDQIEMEVEAFRKEALKLQDKRDKLHTRIDMLRSGFLAQEDGGLDPEEVELQLSRVGDR